MIKKGRQIKTIVNSIINSTNLDNNEYHLICYPNLFDMVDIIGQNILFYLVEEFQNEDKSYLENNNQYSSIKNKNIKSFINFAIKNGMNINSTDNYDRTLLYNYIHKSVSFNDISCFDFLIKKGLNLNLEKEDNKIVDFLFQRHNIQLINYYIKHQPNQIFNTNKNNDSLLHLLSASNILYLSNDDNNDYSFHNTILKSIFDSPYVDKIINYQNKNGDTALHLCIKNSKNKYFIDLLLNKNANLLIQNNNNYRPVDLLLPNSHLFSYLMNLTTIQQIDKDKTILSLSIVDSENLFRKKSIKI